jgi:tetratricopeptide (TPR) repeat protein
MLEDEAPQMAQHAVVAATVSADALRHPLSASDRRLLEKARASSMAGDHAGAAKQLRAALKKSSAAPFAHGLLGGEYLHLDRYQEAAEELEESLRFMPHWAAIRLQLAYVDWRLGWTQRAEEEIRRVLDLDRKSSEAHLLAAAILLSRDFGEQEALEHLRAAGPSPAGHMLMAIYDAHRGRKEEEAREVREYLGSERAAEFPNALKWVDDVTARPALLVNAVTP